MDIPGEVPKTSRGQTCGPDGSPAHGTDVCNEVRGTCPHRVGVDAPCCRRLALSLEFPHGSPARSPDLCCTRASRHRPGSSLLSPSNSRPGPAPANRGPDGSWRPLGPRPPDCRSQAFRAPTLRRPGQAFEGRCQVLSSLHLSFQGAWTGLVSMAALPRKIRPCRPQAEVAHGHRHSGARQ